MEKITIVAVIAVFAMAISIVSFLKGGGPSWFEIDRAIEEHIKYHNPMQRGSVEVTLPEDTGETTITIALASEPYLGYEPLIFVNARPAYKPTTKAETMVLATVTDVSANSFTVFINGPRVPGGFRVVVDWIAMKKD
jgi:hypothetical protein